MRVAIELSVYRTATAGIARYITNLVTCLMEAAPDVHFELYSPRPIQIRLPEGNWRLRSANAGEGLVTAYWLQRYLPRMLAEDRVDVFWGQNHLLPFHLRSHCFRLLTIHDVTSMLCPWTMPLRARVAARLTFARAARSADRIVTVSNATAHLVQRSLRVPAERISVVYPGADERFRPVPRPAARHLIADKYGVAEPYLITVGTIEPRKDHLTLLRALGMTQHVPVLVQVGVSGWKSGTAMREIRRSEKAGKVRYLGRVDDSDLPALYSAASLMIFPSFYEGFGSPVAEAMACGCPVLCSWSSSLPEVAGDAAVYFRPRDAHDLSGKMKQLLDHQDRLVEMSSRGLSRVRRFSYRSAAVQFLRIMEDGIRAAPR